MDVDVRDFNGVDTDRVGIGRLNINTMDIGRVNINTG